MWENNRTFSLGPFVHRLIPSSPAKGVDYRVRVRLGMMKMYWICVRSVLEKGCSHAADVVGCWRLEKQRYALSITVALTATGHQRHYHHGVGSKVEVANR